MNLIVRDVVERDAEAIAAIYKHHVLTGTASYDIEPPDEDFHRAKIGRITGRGWPFLAAQVDSTLVAYAYVTQFRDRSAYRFTAEDSIYVHPEWTGQGIGKRLLQQLIERSASVGFRTIIAVIGGAAPASIGLHAALGFREAGRLRSVGYKLGRWLDSVYMQRDLEAGPDLALAPLKD